MAIPPVFNSNTPFIIVAGGSELCFLGTEDSSKSQEDGKDSLVHVIAPHLSRVMQQGTAKHVVTEGPEVSEENPCVSIVAQAQSEDFQEFSPTSTRRPYARCQQLQKLRPVATESAFVGGAEDEVCTAELLHHNLQWKQRRKARTRRSQGDGEEPPVIRGLWVQEIDWLKSVDGDAESPAHIIPPPPQFIDSLSDSCCHADQHSYIRDDVCNCVRGLEDATQSEDQSRSTETASTSSSSEDRGGSDTDCDLEGESESVRTHESDSDSACCAEDNTHAQDSSRVQNNSSHLTLDLMHVSGFTSCHAEWDLEFAGCVQSPDGHSDSTCTADTGDTSQHAFGFDDLSDSDAVLEKLRGTVTWMPKHFVSPLFKDVMRETRKDCGSLNEGLLFHHKLRPSSSQYREGEEYCILYHIQNGSYGDVFCVRDKSTGFKCAAKRIPLSRFSRDEVCSWSLLDSPRVVELFGAVRDGLNVVLFMDLKPACLAQLLKKMKPLPENLALHYLHQCLEALEHLHHRRVLHLDVKADNVLLSADCRDTFLCDFGLSETLDDSGWSTKAFGGTDFPGTETHMAPEVARGDQLCAKADVWSSCCMLLHMLNGCPPWIRYYSHPLCLQIVNEPPPLWEVPSTCNNFTAKVFRAGLQKDPDRRATAKDLRRRTTKALRAVGGLSPWSVKTACEILHRGRITPNKPSASASAPTMHWVSPWRTAAVEEDTSDWEDGDSDQDSDVTADSATKEWDSPPKSLLDDYAAEEKAWDTWSDSDIDMYMGEEEFIQERWLKMDKDYEADWEEDGQEEEVEVEEEDEAEWDSSTSTEYLHALRGLFPLLRKGQQTNDSPWGSEAELGYLRDDVAINTVNQTPSPEPRDDPPSCFSCSDTSPIDASEKDSDHSSDDLSSGVFSSCNSQSDGHLEWLASANQPTSHCFEGVDIWIENIQGNCLRIREHRQVKVGHIAIGISQQMSGKAFTFETLDRKLVSFEEEVTGSCVWLRCVPAPDTCQHWKWRVRDSKLEVKE